MERIKNYVIIGIILVAAFFAGGYFVGDLFTKSDMSDETCKAIENNIRSLTGAYDRGAEKLKELNDIFARNCKDRKIEIKVEPKDKKINTEPLPAKTCAAVELLLQERVSDMYERDQMPNVRFDRAQIYANMSTMGCPENREKYKALAVREIEIGRALSAPDIWLPSFVPIYKQLGMVAEATAAINEAAKRDDWSPEDIQDMKRKLFE